MLNVSSIKNMIPATWREALRDRQVQQSLRHVCGPATVPLGSCEAAVTCLVKNGEFYIDQFVEHYMDLGFAHIVFLDNGSSDRTIERAASYANVTVYSSPMSVAGFQRQLKRSVVAKCLRAGWCLDADIDEFFDYPYSDTIPLSAFLGYLQDCRYTAVLTHLLDMFPEGPVVAAGVDRSRLDRTTQCWYDLSAVSAVRYEDEPLTRTFGRNNTLALPGSRVYWGGVRLSAFGVKCFLTKHSLFRVDAGLQLFPHVHYVDNAHVADVSTVLLHYKFAGSFLEGAEQNREAFTATRANYERAIHVLETNTGLSLYSETAKRWKNAEDLVAQGFLSASDAYYLGDDKGPYGPRSSTPDVMMVSGSSSS